MPINKEKIISTLLSPVYLTIDKMISSKNKGKNRNKNKRILVIFLGEIGDYILFRNFIKEIKKDSKYSSYSITLCGNPLWKNISENHDKPHVENFIWIDRKKFLTNPLYRFISLKKIAKKHFEVVLRPSYGRSFSVDSIVRDANSTEKIGSEGSPDGNLSWQRKMTNKYYTKLAKHSKDLKFEFLTNKEFFQFFLNKKISTSLSLRFKNNRLKDRYVVITPGAGAKFREWSTDNFAEVSDFLSQKYKLKIKILGSKKDSKTSEKIIQASKHPKFIEDLTGNTLSDSIDIIGNAKLLVSNDTGAVHMAAAMKIPTICISNGNQFGIFHPYPKIITEKVIHIYPLEMKNKTFKKLVENYSVVSDLNIDEINSKEVIKAIKYCFSKKFYANK